MSPDRTPRSPCPNAHSQATLISTVTTASLAKELQGRKLQLSLVLSPLYQVIMRSTARYAPPSVSRRVSLRFLPEPADEQTSTLVLNAGGRTNLFTDFRPLLRDPTLCEWAFAGEKMHLEDGRCQWSHLVDSRATDKGTAAMPDVGQCQTLPNGDELESGEMINPTSGKLEAYQEVWRDEVVPAGSWVTVLQLRRVASEGPEGDGDDVRGIFIRIGFWCQGVLRAAHGVVAARWQFDGSWRKVVNYGDDVGTHALPEPRDITIADTTVLIPSIPPDDDEQWRW